MAPNLLSEFEPRMREKCAAAGGTMNIGELHERALEAATRYRKAEAELIGILQQAEDRRVFLARGHSSLFLYVVKELGLSDSVAYNLISVARKAREVPELKAGIATGAITGRRAGPRSITSPRQAVAERTPLRIFEPFVQPITNGFMRLERIEKVPTYFL